MKLLFNPYVLLGVGIVAIGIFLYVRYLQIDRDSWRAKHDQVQATLDRERESHKQAAKEAKEKRTRDLADAAKHADTTREHLQERIAFHAANADAILERLRRAERGRLRPLAPAASAPADCGNYEADPTRLSEPHQRFLVGEAAAAEEQGDLLEACRADYETVKIACGVKEKP